MIYLLLSIIWTLGYCYAFGFISSIWYQKGSYPHINMFWRVIHKLFLCFFFFISKFMRSECRLSKYVYDRRLPVSRLVSAVGDSIFYWQIQHLWHNNSLRFQFGKGLRIVQNNKNIEKKEQLPTNYPSQKNVKIK